MTRPIPLLLLLLSCTTTTTADTPITPHSVPSPFASTERFTVTVDTVRIPVFHAGLHVFFASFDFTSPADVSVIASPVNQSLLNLWKGGALPDEPPATPDYWKSAAIVRPLSRTVAVKTDANIARFTLTHPGQYSLEPPGLSRHTDEVLFLFANPPEPDRPSPADPNVIYLKPGVHERDIDLTTGQTLYLEPGAVLYGAVNIWNAQHVAIRGRGVIVFDHPLSKDADNGPPNRRNQHPLTTHHVTGLTIDGVTFVNLRRTWSLQLHTTTGLRMDNAKVLSLNPANANGDGIDWLDGGDAIVRKCLIRAADDCFAFFAAASIDETGWHAASPPSAPLTGSIQNITIDHCTLWSTYANILRLGWANQTLTTDHITLRDCDILHVSHNPAPQVQSWSLLATSATARTPSTHAHYLIENLRFEESFGLIDTLATPPILKHFTFRNLTMTGNPREHYRGTMKFTALENAHFENVRLNGKDIRSFDDL